jgi:hypothetical protein
MALRVVAILILLILTEALAIAQDSVKRSIFEDCDKARSEFEHLSIEQRSTLLDFLNRVIALNTQSPSAPEVYAVVPGTQISGDNKGLTSPHGADLIPGMLWQSMDSKRELRAKKCALDLLEKAGAISLEILPSLISTYSEQPLSDEIAVGLEETTATIAEMAHVSGSTLTPEQIAAIAPYALGQRPLVARNILHEFKQESLPFLLSLIAKKDLQVTPEIQRYLHTIDPDGSQSLRAAIGILPDLSPDQIHKITSSLSLPIKSALPPLMNELIELSTNPTYSAAFVKILGSACVSLGGVNIDHTQQQRIANIPNILAPDNVSREQAECLIQSSDPLAKKITEMLTSNDTPQRIYAIELIERGLIDTPAEIRNEAYNQLRHLALHPESIGWDKALSSLRAFPEHKAETVSLAQQLLKAAVKNEDLNLIKLRTALVFNVLSSLNIGKEVSRFSDAIIQSVKSSAPAPSALELARHAVVLDPHLVTLALSTPPSNSSLLALNIITSRAEIPQKALLSLIELLKYPDALPLAERGLLTFGKGAVASIRKTQSRLPQGPAKLAALGALIQTGTATRTEVHTVAKGISTLSDCSFIAHRGGLICGLTGYGRDDRDLSEIILDINRRCIAEFDTETMLRLTQCSPDLVFNSAEELGSALKLHSDAEARFKPALDLALHDTTDNQVRGDKLRARLLLNGSPDIQTQILKSLSPSSALAPETHQAILELSAQQPKESKGSPLLMRALAYTGDTEYPWRDFVKEAIEETSKGVIDPDTAKVISIIPVDAVLSEVIPALESDNSERLVGAALVGGALGTKAVPLVSRLWHLRTMRSPSIRYSASLALLEINPLTPDMHETLKKILVNRFFDTAQTMPIKWTDTVAVNDLERSSFGTLRQDRLEKLLTLK